MTVPNSPERGRVAFRARSLRSLTVTAGCAPAAPAGACRSTRTGAAAVLAAGALALGAAWVLPAALQPARAAAEAAAAELLVPTPRPRPYAGTPRARPFAVALALPEPRPTTVQPEAPRARPLEFSAATPRPAPRGHVDLPAARPLPAPDPAAPDPVNMGGERASDAGPEVATGRLGTAWDAAMDRPMVLETEDLAGIAPSAGTPHRATPAADAPEISFSEAAEHDEMAALLQKAKPQAQTVDIAMAANPLPLPAPTAEALQETSWTDPTAGIARMAVPEPRPRPATIFPSALLRAPVAPAPAADNLNVLTEQDAALYARAFDLQAEGRWAEADKTIRRIQDRMLMGHLQEQRLMHPTAYRAKFTELQAWMRAYADHPDADRVHRLAQQRRPAGADLPAPRAADLAILDAALAQRGDSAGATAAPAKSGTARRGSLSAVRKAYYSGRYGRALEVAGELARSHGARQPGAAWYAGLSAWRLQRYAEAARHFAALAAFETAGPWERAAGGYWAARAYLTLGQPAAAIHSLQQAAEYSRTFYGLLAARRLGLDPVFGWTKLSDDENLVNALFAVPAVKRALALAQTGQRDRARAELRLLMDARRQARDGVFLPMLTALLGLTGDAQTAYRMARLWHDKTGEHIDPAMYPEVPWQPHGGFTFDRALIYAFVRKESRFDPVAKSPAGARGLMQLMPATARFVNGGSRNLSRILNDPAGNLELGQRYIRHLERDVGLGSDLIRIAIAYNAGPGNLEKWDRQADHGGDPLLLIESLPSAETRDFVERILANLWVYRARLGQPSPSLDDLAGGAWPRYVPLDERSKKTELSRGKTRNAG